MMIRLASASTFRALFERAFHFPDGRLVDGSRFDKWTRSLALSRLGVLCGIAGAAAAALFGVIARDEAEATKKRSLGIPAPATRIAFLTIAGRPIGADDAYASA